MGDKKPKAQEATELAITPVQNRMLSYQEIEQIGKAFVASGMFGRDLDRTSKAITKIMAGQELGMAPFAAMRAVHVIDGNATLSANTMAAMVKRSGKYDYTVDKKDADGCTITFFEIRDGKRYKIGVETFDKEEAQTAGLMGKSNWKNYPKAMMFARCMSNGVRTYCPDVFSGMLVYTPDEMGGKVDDSGHYAGSMDKVIDMDPSTGEIKEPEPQKPAEDPKPETETPVEETPEVEPEPEVLVDDSFKEETQTLIDSIGLSPMGKMRFLKENTNKVTPKNLTDKDWRTLREITEAYLNGEKEVPAEWMPSQTEDKKVPENVDPETGEVLDLFPGAEVIGGKEAASGEK